MNVPQTGLRKAIIESNGQQFFPFLQCFIIPSFCTLFRSLGIFQTYWYEEIYKTKMKCRALIKY